jgi:hypothetical protein
MPRQPNVGILARRVQPDPRKSPYSSRSSSLRARVPQRGQTKSPTGDSTKRKPRSSPAATLPSQVIRRPPDRDVFLQAAGRTAQQPAILGEETERARLLAKGLNPSGQGRQFGRNFVISHGG